MKAICTGCYTPQIVFLESGDDLGMFRCGECGERLKKCSENKYDDYYRSGEFERRRTPRVLKAKREGK